MQPPPAFDAPESEPVLRSWQALLVCLVLVAAVAQLAYYYPRLPEQVPTHFGPDNRADAWGGKQAFAITYAGVLGGLAALFLGLAVLLRRLPDGAVNLPNREYWLAPERRERTMGRVARELLLMGGASLLFVTATFHLSIRVALAGTDRLPTSFWAALTGFVLFTAAWAARFMLAFRKPAR